MYYWSECTFTLEKVLTVFTKPNIHPPYVPGVSLLGTYAREMKMNVHKKNST